MTIIKNNYSFSPQQTICCQDFCCSDLFLSPLVKSVMMRWKPFPFASCTLPHPCDGLSMYHALHTFLVCWADHQFWVFAIPNLERSMDHFKMETSVIFLPCTSKLPYQFLNYVTYLMEPNLQHSTLQSFSSFQSHLVICSFLFFLLNMKHVIL